jgi:signal transduction histidine kinase
MASKESRMTPQQEIAFLRNQVGSLSRLLAVNAEMNSALLRSNPNASMMLPTIMQAAMELTGCESAAVLLWDYDRNQLQFTATNATNEGAQALVGTIVPLESLAGTSLRERRTVIVDDVTRDERHYQGVDQKTGFITRSLMVVPMVVSDNVIGVLEVVNKRVLPFTAFDERILTLLGQEAAVAIENARLVMAINAANVQLAEVDKLKDNFMSIANHELRTPLGAILGYAEFLREDATNEDTTEFANNLMKQALHLRDILDSMASLRYLSEGSKELTLERVRIQILLKDAEQDVLAMPTVGKRNILIDPVDGDLKSITDRARVGLALNNILRNAVRFTAAGGTISISVADKPPREIWITVADTGIGIAEDQLEKIFQDFYQIENPMTRKHGGLGIGLSVARAVLKLAHARVWAESDGDGLGARFIIALPRA